MPVRQIIIATLLCLSFSSSSWGQITKDTLSYPAFTAHYNKDGALRDIKQGKICVLLPGGLIGATISQKDNAFETKYRIRFVSRGCNRFAGENEAAYNQEMFKYLDATFGKEWRDEIRKDVIGLTQ